MTFKTISDKANKHRAEAEPRTTRNATSTQKKTIQKSKEKNEKFFFKKSKKVKKKNATSQVISKKYSYCFIDPNLIFDARFFST